MEKQQEKERQSIYDILSPSLRKYECFEAKEVEKMVVHIQQKISELRKPSESELIGQTDEELVQKITDIIEHSLLNAHVPNFEDEDGDSICLIDFISHTDTIDSGIENIHSLVDGMDAPEQIAKLLLTRSQENDVNVELLEALKGVQRLRELIEYKEPVSIEHYGEASAISVMMYIVDTAISNVEKQKSHEKVL